MSDSETVEIRPNPGPQEQFLACPADIAIYGGAAGGGKSWALLLLFAMAAHVRKFEAVVFRRESVQLRGAGSLWEAADELLPLLGGVPRESPDMEYRFPNGGIVDFRHMQHEKHKSQIQGKEYAIIAFDELTHFLESQFWYAVSRQRSKSGIKPMIRGTCNPDPDSFVRRLIDWWIDGNGFAIPQRSGVIRWFVRDKSTGYLDWADSAEELESKHPGMKAQSLTFIASTLDDNPQLTGADPGYKARLDSLPLIERARLLNGNWDIRPAAGNHFRRTWFNLIEQDDPIIDEVVAWVRGWDLAASEVTAENPNPDWTAGALVGVTRDERYVIRHIERGRWSPGKVRDAVKRCGQHDGKGTHICLWQDPGQAGKDQMASYRGHLAGFAVKTRVASQNKLAYADIWSPLVERGQVYVVRGPTSDPWHEAFFLEGDGFPDGKHDDQIDAVSRAMVELTARFKHKRAKDAWKKAVV